MTPTSLDELLKDWEKEAKLEGSADVQIMMAKVVLEQGRKILALIAVVRKQTSDMRKIFECADCRYAIKISEASIDEAERILTSK